MISLATDLNLSNIVDVAVYVSPILPPRSTFNHGLIIGSSTIGATPHPVIPTSERVREYTRANDMLDDGFSIASPEYLAAVQYFSQSPTPRVLWVGCQDVTKSTPETALDAWIACREVNRDWYAGMVCGVTDDQSLLIAEVTEAMHPSTTYFYATDDPNTLTPIGSTPTDIGAIIKGLNYSRSFGNYATNKDNSAAGDLGLAMGLNTGLANSAYTMKFKTVVGVTTENLTQTQVNYIESRNLNVYVAYAGGYHILEQGVMGNGQFFDEIINIDMLANNIQLNVMDLLISNPKIPLTDAGVTQIMRAINNACDQAVTIGFLSTGIWQGAQVLNLKYGDPVPGGYVTQAPSVSTLTPQQRNARQSPPIYVAITEAGAVHSVLIGVYVQR